MGHIVIIYVSVTHGSRAITTRTASICYANCSKWKRPRNWLQRGVVMNFTSHGRDMNEMGSDADTFADHMWKRRTQRTQEIMYLWGRARVSGHLRLALPFSLSFHASPRFNYFLNHIRLRAMWKAAIYTAMCSYIFKYIIISSGYSYNSCTWSCYVKYTLRPHNYV